LLNADGSVTLTVASGMLPDIDDAGWGSYANYRISIDRAVVTDHALLSSTDPTTGWFVRNEWYRLLYYAVARGHSADVAAAFPNGSNNPPVCPTTVNTGNGPNQYPFTSSCLSVTNLAGAHRALLVLAGRSINGATRPSANLGDYLEFGNANGAFVRATATAGQPPGYADTGAANSYAISAGAVAVGAPLYFKAENANTGAATLTTPVLGAMSVRNADGSPLASGQIVAKGLVQVRYDGTNFVLSQTPFNDRVIAVDSN
jgi:hypothetical protein